MFSGRGDEFLPSGLDARRYDVAGRHPHHLCVAGQSSEQRGEATSVWHCNGIPENWFVYILIYYLTSVMPIWFSEAWTSEIIDLDPSERDMRTPITVIKEGYEPATFIGYFESWNHAISGVSLLFMIRLISTINAGSASPSEYSTKVLLVLNQRSTSFKNDNSINKEIFSRIKNWNFPEPCVFLIIFCCREAKWNITGGSNTIHSDE